MVKQTLSFALSSIVAMSAVAPALAATCVGADPCHACHTCEYCKRCAGRGLKCGVCKGSRAKHQHRLAKLTAPNSALK